MATTSRLIEVYRILGRILDDPEAFGLGHRAPRTLVEVLTTSRQKLMEELSEQRRWEGEDASLEAELAQDADVRVPGKF